MFVTFTTINPENGAKINVRINPSAVCFVAPAMIPGEITGPDGEKVGKPAALINFGLQSLLVDLPLDKVVKILDAASTPPPLKVIKFPAKDLNNPNKGKSEE